MQVGAIAAAVAIVLVVIIVVVMHKTPAAAAAAKCTADSDCATGKICDTTTGACVAGCDSSAACAQANPALPYCVGGQCAAACVVGSTTALCANDASQCIDQKCTPCTNVAGGGTSTGCPSTAPFCFTTGGFPAGKGTCIECGYNPATNTSYGCATDQVCAPSDLQGGPGACTQCFLDQPGSATNPGIGCKNNPAVYKPGTGALGACFASSGLTGTGPGQCYDCVVWSEGVSVGCSGNNVCTSTSGATGPGTCSPPAAVHASKKMQLSSQFGNP